MTDRRSQNGIKMFAIHESALTMRQIYRSFFMQPSQMFGLPRFICPPLHPQANTGASKLGSGADLARRLSNFLGSDVGKDTIKVRYD